MTDMGRWICIIAGALGLLWFLLPVFSGLIINIGNITGAIVFGTLLLLALNSDRFFSWIRLMRSTRSGSSWLAVLAAVLISIFTLAGVLEYVMIREANNRDDAERTLVILGCGVYGERPSLMLIERMQAAYEYMSEHPDVSCVLSGGKGQGEDISEAEAMYRWLTAKGISADRLYKEDRSVSTRQNLEFTKKILQTEDLPMRIRIVTNEFHEYRAGQIADKLELDHCALPAPTAWWLYPTYAVREMYAILYERFF